MARIPVVESPCPIAGKQLPAGDTEHCSRCERTVHNLDRMSERERRDFMSACGGNQVCVAYTVRVTAAPIRAGGLRQRALPAAALAAAAMASLPLAAQESLVVGQSPMPDANGLRACDEYVEIVVGGVNKGDEAQWADDGKDAPPDLPTMEDDGK